MPELNFETDAANLPDVKRLEEALEKLWEKARHVSDTVIRLKEETRELRERIESLEANEGRLVSDVREREQEVGRLRAQIQHLQSNGNGMFSREDQEELKIRLRDLITRINARL